MFATRTQAQNALEAADAERSAAEARLAASKRYRGRADDTRLLDSLNEICSSAAEAIRDFDEADDADTDADTEADEADEADEAEAYAEWEQEDIEATQRAYEAEQTFRQRVAERAHFLALAGWGSSDDERWFEAERLQRSVDRYGEFDEEEANPNLSHPAPKATNPFDHEGERLTPAERRRRDRAVGLH